MSKLIKIVMFIFCLMLFPYFSIATDTFTASKDIWIYNGEQDSQVIYKILKGTTVNINSTNGSWHNISYNRDGKDVTGWICLQLVQSPSNPDSYVTTEEKVTTEDIDFNTPVTEEYGTKTQKNIEWSARGKTFTTTGYEVIYPQVSSEWLKFSSDEDSQINPIFAKRLEKLAQDLGQEIQISSGFRSMSTQIGLIKSASSTKYELGDNGHLYYTGSSLSATAAPGSSRHQLGVAVDIKTGKVGNYIREKMSNAMLEPYGLYKPWRYEDWHIEPIETRTTILYESQTVKK